MPEIAELQLELARIHQAMMEDPLQIEVLRPTRDAARAALLEAERQLETEARAEAARQQREIDLTLAEAEGAERVEARETSDSRADVSDSLLEDEASESERRLTPSELKEQLRDIQVYWRRSTMTAKQMARVMRIARELKLDPQRVYWGLLK